MKQTVLITGGAGYIGSHVNLMLAEAGWNTVVVDTLERGHQDLVKAGGFVHGDIGDQSLLASIFSNYNIVGVMHLAAYAYVGESWENPALYYRNNVVSTMNLLDAMHAYGIDKIVFSSSCCVYGETDRVPVDESAPEKPINPYGNTKLMGEKAIRDYAAAYGLQHVIYRYFNAAGAHASGLIGERHLPETHLIPLVLRACMDGDHELSVFGDDYPTADGTCVRDYIHVTDVARAHVMALEHLVEGGQSDTFNLGVGTGYSVMDIIKAAQEVSGREPRYHIAGKRSGDAPEMIADASRVEKVLGWKPECSDLRTILRHAWQWMQLDASKK